MDNKQLLIEAAKAAGYDAIWNGEVSQMLWKIRGWPEVWNPIESDADAFRLMVDCGASSTQLNHSVLVIGSEGTAQEFYDDHNADKHAATRLAVTRAAAQSQESNQ